MTSEKKIKANRRNAQKSTGPRTEAGKARSSKNAFTHGLTAQQVVLWDEDPAAFEALRSDLFEYYRPTNPVAKHLVEHVTACIWRLRRVPEIEAGIYSHFYLKGACYEDSHFSIDTATGEGMLRQPAHWLLERTDKWGRTLREPDNDILPVKAALIDKALELHQIRSIADLGACWGVNGGYSFYTMSKTKIDLSVIVDTRITELSRDRARDFPQATFVEGFFGDQDVVEQVGDVDAALMFSVLLHQVSPDWNKVLELYSRVPVLIIYNQNWTGTEHTLRFPDLPLEEYLRRVYHHTPEMIADWYGTHNEMHPTKKRLMRDIHQFWQWGITDADLKKCLASLGYSVDLHEDYGIYSAKYPEIRNIGLICSKPR